MSDETIALRAEFDGEGEVKKAGQSIAQVGDAAEQTGKKASDASSQMSSFGQAAAGQTAPMQQAAKQAAGLASAFDDYARSSAKAASAASAAKSSFYDMFGVGAAKPPPPPVPSLAASTGFADLGAADLTRTRRSMIDLQSVLDTTGRKFGTGEGAVKGFGQTVMATGRIVQDFSAAGLNGIINNLEQVGVGLAKLGNLSAGAGALIGGGLQLAGVALQYLMNHYDDILKMFGLGKTETEAERMDRLAKATSRTAAETAELVKHKERQAAVEQLLASKTKEQGEQAKSVSEALSENGGEATIRRLAQARAKEGGLGLTAEEKKELDLLKARTEQTVGAYDISRKAASQTGLVETDEARYSRRKGEIEEKARGRVQDKAAGDVADALTDPGRLQTLIDEIERRKDPQDAKLLAELKKSLPEAREGKRHGDIIDEWSKQGEGEAEKAMKADDQEDPFLAADAQDSERRLNATKQRRRSRVDSFADSLSDQAIGARATGGEMSREDVHAQLSKSLGKDKADEYADEVFKKLKEATDEAIDKHALKGGLGFVDSAAELAREAAKRKDQKRESAASEVSGDFKKADKNADDKLEKRLLGTLFGQGSPEDVVRELADAMKQSSPEATDEARMDAARKIVEEGQASLTGKIEEGAAKEVKRKAPELFGASDFGRQLLTSDADSLNKQAVDIAGQQLETLKVIARQTGVVPVPKLGK